MLINGNRTFYSIKDPVDLIVKDYVFVATKEKEMYLVKKDGVSPINIKSDNGIIKYFKIHKGKTVVLKSTGLYFCDKLITTNVKNIIQANEFGWFYIK